MTLHLAVNFEVVSCGADGCGEVFAMSDGTYRRTHRTRETWYCPAGHPRVWGGDTDAQKLEKAQARETHLRDQLQAAEREAENLRIATLRERHRIANGVCPCCSRSFQNVRRHIQGEHPAYDPGPIARDYRCSCGSRFETLRGLRVHQGHRRVDDWWDPKRGSYSRHLTVVPA